LVAVAEAVELVDGGLYATRAEQDMAQGLAGRGAEIPGFFKNPGIWAEGIFKNPEIWAKGSIYQALYSISRYALGEFG
jgi:hypothetical protein